MSYSKNLNRIKGLSLVELQIAGAILAGITLLLGSVYYMQTRMFGEEKANIQLASENQIAVEEITNQILESTGVVTNCTACVADTNSSSTVLILEFWPLDANGNPTDPLGTNYDYIVYKKTGTNLIKNVFASQASTRKAFTNKILSSLVKTVLFEYDNADPAQATEVTLTLENETKSFIKTHTYSQNTKAKLRNK